MRRQGPRVLALLLLLAPLVAASAVSTTDATRLVTRTLASPTTLPAPLDAVTLLSDHAAWRVDIDPSAVVVVDARASDATPFWLRFHPWDAPTPQSPVPGARQSPTLSGAVASAWRVEVDPALGADVRITVRFHGHVGDAAGRPWPFLLTDAESSRGCAQGTCLP